MRVAHIGAMPRDELGEPLGAIAIERVERFVEQPKWLARPRDAGEHGPLALPRRQVAHGHLREIGQAERLDRGGGRCAPHSQRSFEREFMIEREIVIGERERRGVDATALGFEQPGGEADQARLAAAVRPPDPQRLASLERQV